MAKKVEKRDVLYWHARASAADSLLKAARKQVMDLKAETMALRRSMGILEESRKTAGVTVEQYVKRNTALNSRYSRVRNTALNAASLIAKAISDAEKTEEDK